ncbi:MAG: hypothetical protein ACRDDX_08355 [Cellulosilyticaceae bacterium]
MNHLSYSEKESLSMFYLLFGYDVSVFLDAELKYVLPFTIAINLTDQPISMDDSFYTYPIIPTFEINYKLLSYLEAYYQALELRLGLASGVDIHHYWSPYSHSANEMKQVRLGLEANLPVHLYNYPALYNAGQMEQIRLGLLAGVDTSIYDKPERYTAEEMRAIRLSL